MLFDRFGRKIEYLRISVTNACNLRCAYCVSPHSTKQQSRQANKILAHSCLKEISRSTLVEVCQTSASLGISKIRLTGGEPLLRSDICEIVADISVIPGIKDLAMTTNGTRLKDLAPRLKKAGLQRVNVSLDSLDAKKFATTTRGGRLADVLEGIKKALDVGLSPLKVNIVLQRGFNDNEVDAFLRFSEQTGVQLQFIREMELSNRTRLQEFPEIRALVETRPPDCSLCNRIRLTADGKFKPCLFSDIEIDIYHDGIAKALRMAIDAKPEVGHSCYRRKMFEIGG